jgi:hypothetical protein
MTRDGDADGFVEISYLTGAPIANGRPRLRQALTSWLALWL